MDPQNILTHLGPVQFDVTFVQSLRWSPGRHVTPHVHDREFQLDLFSGNGEFTINIALIHRQRAILGVVHAPVKNRLIIRQTSEGNLLVRE